MEVQMHSICNLKTMEVIDVNSGAKIGLIKDFKIDTDEYKIVSLIIPYSKISLFAKNNYIEIPWEKVIKIGVDVILVDGDDFMLPKHN